MFFRILAVFKISQGWICCCKCAVSRSGRHIHRWWFGCPFGFIEENERPDPTDICTL